MASLVKPSMSSSRHVPCLWITVTELRLKKSLPWKDQNIVSLQRLLNGSARLWPNVRSRLSWKTRKWSFLQCHPIHLPVNWFWHLFDSFLTTFSRLLFQLANQNATREGVGWSKSGTWHLRLSKFLHFFCCHLQSTPTGSCQKVVRTA